MSRGSRARCSARKWEAHTVRKFGALRPARDPRPNSPYLVYPGHESAADQLRVHLPPVPASPRCAQAQRERQIAAGLRAADPVPGLSRSCPPQTTSTSDVPATDAPTLKLVECDPGAPPYQYSDGHTRVLSEEDGRLTVLSQNGDMEVIIPSGRWNQALAWDLVNRF